MKKIIRYIKKHKIILALFVILLFAISLSLKIYKFNYKYVTSTNTSRMEVVIESLENIKEDKISYLVKYNGEKFILNIYKNKYLKQNVDIQKFNNFKYGDVISLRGKIKIPEKLGNPYEFDYKKYLNSKNIIGTITTYDVQLLDIKINNIFVKLVYNLKDKVSKRIDDIMPENESNLFKSMLYGNDKFLEEDIKENFEKSGLTHLLAVSGSNIATMFMIVSFISKKLNKSISIIFTLIFSFLFCIFCSFELSIIRASIFLVITNISKKEERNLNVYLKIFLSFCIMILYNPYCIFNIGMIMSYLSIISIVMFQSQIFSLFDISLKNILCIKYTKPQGIKKGIYNIVVLIFFPLSVTIAVQILLFPVQIYFFNSFYLITFFSNIVISYIDNIFGIIGFATLILSFIPVVSEVFANTSFLILRCINFFVEFFSSFESLKIKLATPDIFSIIIYYICILIFNLKKYIPLYIKKKLRINFVIKIVYLFSVIYILVSYIYLNFFHNYVIYFNVEQGNMALIHYNRKNVIVDIGSTTENLASNVIINFLNKKNIEKIDAVILTHFHTDHINGLTEELINSLEIKRVIYASPKEDILEYENMLNLLNKNNISKIEVTKDDNIKIGDIDINILNPNVNEKIEDDDIANANSIVSVITVNNKQLMFMGDATKNTEKSILNKNNNLIKNIDIYQVGHHGSKTSTLDEFISKLKINIAIISSKKKVYNHPSQETLNTLFKHNITIKITEKNGAFKFNI